MEYEITNNVYDRLPCSKINEWMKKENTGISTIKMTRQIKEYCKLNKFNNVLSTTKRNNITKKSQKVWLGIREPIPNKETDYSSGV